MNREYFVSVAIATFNGQKYIKEQLESILKQLSENDEIIVSDDGSTDNTIEIVKALKDKRIKVYSGPKRGVKQNFANAIEKCHGKYVFLCDQDDIWLDNKVRIVLDTFEKEKCTCVVHDAQVFDSDKNEVIIESFYRFRNSKPGIVKNIIKNSYIGCCMAFDRTIVNKLLPIPDKIEMHDQWIGIICEKYGKSIFIDSILLKYRRHSSNVTSMKHHSAFRMVYNRVRIIIDFWRR